MTSSTQRTPRHYAAPPSLKAVRIDGTLSFVPDQYECDIYTCDDIGDGATYEVHQGVARLYYNEAGLAKYIAHNQLTEVSQKEVPQMNRSAPTHYIYMSGLRGYMPDNCGSTDTLRAAIDSLLSLFDRTTDSRVACDLRKYGYASLNNARDGAEYCEVTPCDCDTPEDHNDN